MLIENPYYQVQGLKKEEVLAEFKNLPIWDRREVLEKILGDSDEDESFAEHFQSLNI